MQRAPNFHSVFLLFSLAVAPILAAQSVQHGPSTVRQDVHHDVSPPLRDLIQNAPPPSLERQESEPVLRIPLPPGLPELSEDPIRQRVTLPSTAIVGLSFEGLGDAQYGFQVNRIPPDTEGAVGATQYVQWVNAAFAIFDKSSGALLSGPTFGNTLWSGFGGGCEEDNDGDPIALYDKLDNRWVMSQFSVSTPPYLQCIAVSTSSDATGTWNRYSFQYTNYDDYPKMGVWPDAYYETFNMFDNNNNFFGADACAYDRTAMLNGGPATQQCFQQGSSVGGLLPADVDGTTPPPAGSPNYMLNFGANSLNLYQFHVDFNNPANSTFSGPTVIDVAAFTPLCSSSGFTCVPQPAGTLLDSLADRVMYRLAYRNFGTHESLVVNHSVMVSGGGGVRWYEVQNPLGTPVLTQQGTYAPDSTYRWMGSVAMDQAGNLAVGYSKSSRSVYPSIAFAGRLSTDAPGMLEAETDVVDGMGSQTPKLHRWGDYSAMTVDPVDDCTFWYTQEYILFDGTYNWNTHIVNFKFPGCPGPTLTVSPSGNGTVTSTDGLINCPGTCSHSYISNTQVTLNAAPAQGWAFAGWSGACSGTGSCMVTMTQNQSVGATFTQIFYTLTVSTSGNGSVTSTDGFINCPSTCSHLYPANTQVTLNANPAAGWTLSSWSGACSGTGACVVTMTQNQSMGATFTQLSYTLTVAPIGSGTVTSTDGFINCPGTCSHSYLSFTQVTLNALPGQGWVFGGWDGGCLGTGSCTLTMTQSLTVDAVFSQAEQFVSVTPCRLVDTRPQYGGGGPIQGMMSETFNLPQLAQLGKNCPAFDLSSAAAYSLNVAVVPQGPLGYLTMWPAGLPQPYVATLNSVDGRVKAVATIVGAGASQAVSVYVTNTTDVIIDIDGYFTTPSQQTLQFYPLPPCRVADTRYATGFGQGLGAPYLSGGVPRVFPVLNAAQNQVPCNIPSTAQAYSLNFAAVPHGSLGYLTVWPTGESQPLVATLNAIGGQITANAAITVAGTAGNAGEISTFATNDTDLVIDINGYFAPPGANGLSWYPAVPCRGLDTRKAYGGNGPFDGTLSPPVDLRNSPCAVSSAAQAYVLNATVVPTGEMGYLTLWPDSIGIQQPVVATLNALDGIITNNLAIVPAGNEGGKINAYADQNTSPTDLVLDIFGYFAP